MFERIKTMKQPEIRFKGFSDEWVEKKLGEIGYFKSGVGFPVIEQGGTVGHPFYKVSDMNTKGNNVELISANNYVSDDQIRVKNWKPINTLPAIVFAKVGAALLLNRKRIVEHPFLIDNNLMAYSFDKSWDMYFGKTWFDTVDLPKYAQTGALPSFNASDIERIHVLRPTLPEQQKIGALFSKYDAIVALREQKLEELNALKKGMLQQMFVENGAKVPELRFGGFADDWEERKLSNESTITAGGDIDKSKLKEVGEYPIFANALTNDGTVGYYDSYYRVEAPAVTVTGRGDVGHAKARKVNFTPVVRLLAVKSNHDVDFLENAINNHKVLVESTGVPQLTAPQLGNYKIFFPTGEEQQKIGQLFKHLDTRISNEQTKIEQLKVQKQGLLQRML